MLMWMRKKMKTIILALAIVFMGTMFYGITMSRFGQQTPNKNYIATINKKPINKQIFMDALNQLAQQKSLPAGRQGENLSPDQIFELQYQALQDTIRKSILLEEARRRRIGASGEEADIAVSQIMESNKITSLQDLEKALKNQGQTLNQFKKNLREEIKLQKVISRAIGSAGLAENDFKEIKARQIFIKTDLGMKPPEIENRRQKAEFVLKQLKSGADFSALARKYSEDALTKDQGGDLGYLTSGILPREIENPAFSLNPGGISEIIKTASGFYIIKVEDKRLRVSPDKDKDLRTYLTEIKQKKAYEEWQKELDKRYKVEIENKVMRGMQARDKGDLELAATELQSAQVEDSGNPYLLLILGEVYKKQGKKDLAIATFKKAAEMSSGDAKMQITLSKLLNENKQRNQALSLLRKASLIAGDNLALHEELSKVYTAMNAYAEMAAEKQEIARIKKKQAFEDEMRKKAEELLPTTTK